MADDVVDRDAGRVAVALVADRGRGRAGGPHHVMDRGVELERRHPGHHQRRYPIENVGDEPARGVHAGEVLGRVDADAVPVQAAGQDTVQGGLSGGHRSACSPSTLPLQTPARRRQPAFFQTVVRPAPPAATAATPASKSIPGSGLSASSRPLGALGAERDRQPRAVLGGDHPGVRRGRRHVRPGDDLDPHHRRQVDEPALPRPEIGDARLVDHHHPLGQRVGVQPEPPQRRAQQPEPRRRQQEPEHERQRRQRGVAAPGQPAARPRAAPPRPSARARAAGARRARAAAKLTASPRASPATASAPPRPRCRRAAPAARASPAVTNGRPRSRSRLLGREAALGADQHRPGAGLRRRERRGRRRRRALLVAEHQPPRRIPAVEQRREPRPARRARAHRSRRTARRPRWRGRAAGPGACARRWSAG